MAASDPPLTRGLDDPLTADGVRALYLELLERSPGKDDIDAQLAACGTPRELLDLVRASEEYAARLRARAGPGAPAQRPRVNIWHPDVAGWTHPPGTVSADGVAVAGRDGWLFLETGTSANLARHRGERPPPAAWLDAWMAGLALREREARDLGVDLVALVVPDKLAIQEEHFPEPIAPVGPRPVLRLRERAGDALRYPLAELRAARGRGEVSMRADTHLTLHGNHVLAGVVARALDVSLPDLVRIGPLHEQLRVGDLGDHFAPRVVEVRQLAEAFGAATLVADNRAEFKAMGAHVGTRRVLRNAAPPDPRVVVLIGDSYAYPSARYQGIAWWLAQVFAEVHFLWVPFGWDPGYLRDVGADVAVLQIAERFVGHVPHDRVDARALARDTLASGRPAGLDAFCRAP